MQALEEKTDGEVQGHRGGRTCRALRLAGGRREGGERSGELPPQSPGLISAHSGIHSWRWGILQGNKSGRRSEGKHGWF